jgi:hypothetical protein
MGLKYSNIPVNCPPKIDGSITMPRHPLQLLDYDLPPGLRHSGHDQRPLRISFLHGVEQWDNGGDFPQRYGMDPNDGFPKILQFDRDRPKPGP